MTRSALIVGAQGRFGRAVTEALQQSGWRTVLFARRPGGEDTPSSRWVQGDARDVAALSAAAQGQQVIVNALTPPYAQWVSEIPRFTAAMIAGAKASGATILVPGNIYNFGPSMPAVLTEDTPQRATGPLGQARIRMEGEYRAAAEDGVRTLVLRAGDFFERAATGNWFDSQIIPNIARGQILYPGTEESTHSWAYLPDLGRAAALCCERLDQFAPYDSLGFPGYALTGGEFVDLLERAAGRPLKVTAPPWPLIRMLSLVKPDLRGVMEVAYQWRTPHRIDGTRFAALFPQFRATPVLAAFKEAISDRLPATRGDAATLTARSPSHAQ